MWLKADEMGPSYGRDVTKAIVFNYYLKNKPMWMKILKKIMS
jgi:hypothetical protein